MLTAYISQTQALLQNPSAPSSLYQPSQITSWVNIARGQLAGEGECIRYMGSLPVVQGTQVYPFSSIAITSGLGIQGVIAVRQAWRVVGSGQVWMRPRGFEWFGLYKLNNPVPVQGSPTEYSQFGQGAAPTGATGLVGGGSIYIDPVPDTSYTLNLDCVCYPIQLALDTDPEAIPYLWTDAVPFFAAYYALLSAQSSARQADADRMFNRYQEFLNRARRAATPTVLPYQNPQVASPMRSNQLGTQQAAAGGGG